MSSGYWQSSRQVGGVAIWEMNYRGSRAELNPSKFAQRARQAENWGRGDLTLVDSGCRHLRIVVRRVDQKTSAEGTGQPLWMLGLLETQKGKG